MRIAEVPKYFREEIRVPSLGPCHIWTKSKSGRGAGQPSIRELHGKRKYVDHVIWFIAHGYWPKQLNHFCDQRDCGRLEHVYEGTQQQNGVDNRNIGGITIQKLNMSQVHEIRRLYATGKYTQAKLADKFGVGQPHISYILHRLNWGDV